MNQHAPFEQLLDQHRRIIFRVASLYATSREDRLDVAQEIRTQLWKAYPGYRPDRRFSTWMYRIALNVAISHLRRESVRARLMTQSDEDIEARYASLADDSGGMIDERLGVLQRLIDELDPLKRALVMLYLDDHSHAEIAEVLGISETNVATKINRIKQRLRSQAQTLDLNHGEQHGTR